MMDRLRSGPPCEAVLITIDYKMKFESSTAFYRKRVISWHGSVLFYRPTDSDGVGGDILRTERCTDQTTTEIDHVVSNCNTHDIWAAVMILETIFARAPLLL